ncbi:hypothetical protein SDC9_185089 [bioreactor metagenome]|uniref:Uncharacterized protein n=1 Tax=bioreactor metagenome TaxID=1076179 RepID=A0A645HH99_9ZZZZ
MDQGGVDLHSRLGDMPAIVEEAVTRLVAGLGILGPVIEGAAFVSPLLAAVVAHHHAPVADRRRIRGGHQRRPVGGAAAVADAFAGACGILVKDVERHLGRSYQYTIEGGGWRLGRGGRAARAGCQQGSGN